MSLRTRRLGSYLFGIGAMIALAAGSMPSAWSQGTSTEIVIGQSGALSGPLDEIGKEMKTGAEAYFNVVNQAGGVNGRKIRLVSLDDSGEPERAKANTQKLIGADNALALLGCSGEHTIKAILPLVDKARIPFIAAAGGDQNLRDPFNRYVFNIRASYVEETERGIDQYVRRGIDKIALFY